MEVERRETEGDVTFGSRDCETGDEQTEEEPDPNIPRWWETVWKFDNKSEEKYTLGYASKFNKYSKIERFLNKCMNEYREVKTQNLKWKDGIVDAVDHAHMMCFSPENIIIESKVDIVRLPRERETIEKEVKKFKTKEHKIVES